MQESLKVKKGTGCNDGRFYWKFKVTRNQTDYIQETMYGLSLKQGSKYKKEIIKWSSWT